jgi:hypothetical protein
MSITYQEERGKALTTADNQLHLTSPLIVNPDSVVGVDLYVFARGPSGVGAIWHILALLERIGSANPTVAQKSVGQMHDPQAVWQADLVASGGLIQVQVRGAQGVSVDWQVIGTVTAFRPSVTG